MKSFKYYHPKYKITWGDIMADCPTEAFPAICAAVKNINQQILDTESYGRLPHRSISIEIFGSWNFDVGYLDTVASGNRCCTFSENRYRIKTV